MFRIGRRGNFLNRPSGNCLNPPPTALAGPGLGTAGTARPAGPCRAAPAAPARPPPGPAPVSPSPDAARRPGRSVAFPRPKCSESSMLCPTTAQLWRFAGARISLMPSTWTCAEGTCAEGAVQTLVDSYSHRNRHFSCRRGWKRQGRIAPNGTGRCCHCRTSCGDLAKTRGSNIQ